VRSGVEKKQHNPGKSNHKEGGVLNRQREKAGGCTKGRTDGEAKNYQKKKRGGKPPSLAGGVAHETDHGEGNVTEEDN